MLPRRDARLAALALVGFAAALAGCQAGAWSRSGRVSDLVRLRPKTPASQDEPLPTPSDEQKANVQMRLAASLEEKGDLDAAIHAYTAILQKDKTRVDACHRLAVLHDRKGDHSQAAAHYEQACKTNRDDPELLCDYGYSLYVQGRPDAAETHLRRAIKSNPQLARAHNNLGVVLTRRGRSEEALAAFQRAGCTPAEARRNVANALNWEQRWREAEEQLQAALRLDASSPAAQQALAALPQDGYIRVADHAAAGAEEELEVIIPHNPLR